MRSFGKRSNSSDFGFIIYEGQPARPCRIVDRSLKVIRLEFAGSKNVARQFLLVFDNGNEKLYCQTIALTEEGIIARYSREHNAGREVSLNGGSITLGEAERWRGAA